MKFKFETHMPVSYDVWIRFKKNSAQEEDYHKSKFLSCSGRVQGLKIMIIAIIMLILSIVLVPIAIVDALIKGRKGIQWKVADAVSAIVIIPAEMIAYILIGLTAFLIHPGVMFKKPVTSIDLVA